MSSATVNLVASILATTELTRELSALIENNVVVDPSDRTRTGRRSQVYEWI